MIDYRLKLHAPQSHIFEVELTIRNPDPDGQVVYLPAWIRGSYLIRDYARHIVSIEANADGEPLILSKLDKQSWKIEPVKQSITINYQIYAWELTVRSAHFDNTHAYFNGPALFLAVRGQELMPCRLEIVAPKFKLQNEWRVAFSMKPEQIDKQGFGTYQADDYETLIDCPGEIGDYSESQFEVAGCNHRFVVSGVKRFDHEKLGSHLSRICEKQVELFGELPVQDYLFLLRVVNDGYGGLEHKNSTSLIFPRDDLPAKRDTKITSGYRRLLALCSHEYFHLWNVKRITPEVFLEQSTQQEVYTRQLWVFEGITSYYDELMLVRSGVISKQDYFEMLAETVTRVMRGSGRFKQTLEESSFDVWTKFYKQDENAPNAIVSYYAKGTLFALLLDLTIRLQSNGRFSLDQVMREMWLRYGKQGKGVPENGIEKVVADVTSLDLQSLFDLGLRSTAELPLTDCLSEFGVAMKLLPAKSSDDKGGVLRDKEREQQSYTGIGAKWTSKTSGIKVQQVFDDGAAQNAGISAGDEIVAVDGLRMSAKQLENYILDTDAGDQIEVHLFRRDQLMSLVLQPQQAAFDTCYFDLTEPSDEAVKQRQSDWLMGHG
ncbi:MAG: PDZ domain-containing protein [Candidatus Thiodiazotropha taylori]|nr:PDZ domain-containing protein [Candidatus Thiodiazotropha taylori]MCG8106115.1 PDZ domain-containing protein [Candidatus Thiodiazotropha taylori]MCG8111015.1 PDZ domain-containing protein [Candidatus Thiodiazotropha taylori]MCW4278451.1 PDZ domain-containing protein [Candidatus Thiodiazotropha taylori]MCW4283365.1 PDZ domain-containing protein [Candidatus Thiodiazotropha taylori]